MDSVSELLRKIYDEVRRTFIRWILPLIWLIFVTVGTYLLISEFAHAMKI